MPVRRYGLLIQEAGGYVDFQRVVGGVLADSVCNAAVWFDLGGDFQVGQAHESGHFHLFCAQIRAQARGFDLLAVAYAG